MQTTVYKALSMLLVSINSLLSLDWKINGVFGEVEELVVGGLHLTCLGAKAKENLLDERLLQ